MSALSTGTAEPCPACSGPASLSQEEDGMHARCEPCKSPWVPLAEWNSSNLVVVPPTETPRRLWEQSKARLALVAKEGSPVWGEFRKELEELAPAAQAIVVTDANDTAKIKLAKETRLKLRDIRLAADKEHKALKRDIIDRGSAIDAAKREIVDVVVPLEQHLLEQEQFAERKAAAETETRQREREEILRDLVDNPETLPLAAMSEEEFLAMRDFYEARKVAKLDAERKAAAEEAERVRKDAEEREAQRLENERLRKEAAEKEREMAKERAAAAAVAAQEKAAREAAEAELQRQKAEAAAVQRKQREEAEAAAKAPDREKLLSVATMIGTMVLPMMATDAGMDARGALTKKLDDLAAWVRTKAENL